MRRGVTLFRGGPPWTLGGTFERKPGRAGLFANYGATGTTLHQRSAPRWQAVFMAHTVQGCSPGATCRWEPTIRSFMVMVRWMPFGGRWWPSTRRRREEIFPAVGGRSEEHTSELQSRENLVCRLLL